MGGRLTGLTLLRCVCSLGCPESGLDGLKQVAVPSVRGLKLREMARNMEILCLILHLQKEQESTAGQGHLGLSPPHCHCLLPSSLPLHFGFFFNFYFIIIIIFF